MLRNIIIEGPEGSGKTTATKLLIEKFGYNYYHDGPPDLEQIDDNNIGLYYTLILESFKEPWIWDRSIIGELVYGPVFRGKSRLTRERVQYFLGDPGTARRSNLRTILMLPPFETILENWKERREEQARKASTMERGAAFVKASLLNDPDLLVQIWRKYDHLWNDTNIFDARFDSYPTLRSWLEVLA